MLLRTLVAVEMLLFQTKMNASKAEKIPAPAELLKLVEDVFTSEPANLDRKKLDKLVGCLDKSYYNAILNKSENWMLELSFYNKKIHLTAYTEKGATNLAEFSEKAGARLCLEDGKWPMALAWVKDAKVPNFIGKMIEKQEKEENVNKEKKETASRLWQDSLSRNSSVGNLYRDFKAEIIKAVEKTFEITVSSLPENRLFVAEKNSFESWLMGMFGAGGKYNALSKNITVREYGHDKFLRVLAHEIVHYLSFRGKIVHGWDKLYMPTFVMRGTPRWLIEGTTETASQMLIETITKKDGKKLADHGAYVEGVEVVLNLLNAVGDKIFWNSFFKTGNFDEIAWEFCRKKEVTRGEFYGILSRDPKIALERLENLKDRK
jgi:hypothetical protein